MYVSIMNNHHREEAAMWHQLCAHFPSAPVGKESLREWIQFLWSQENKQVICRAWAPSSTPLQSSIALGDSPTAPSTALSTEMPDLPAIVQVNSFQWSLLNSPWDWFSVCLRSSLRGCCDYVKTKSQALIALNIRKNDVVHWWVLLEVAILKYNIKQ